MRFEEALAKTGGDSVGGQLIIQHEGKHFLLGCLNDGYLMVEDNDEARKIMQGLGSGETADAPDAEDHKAPRRRRSRAEIDADNAAEAAADAADVAGSADGADADLDTAEVHHEVMVSDEVITAETLGDAG